MAQKTQTLQDIFRERRMKDMKCEYRREQIGRFFILMRRVALVGALVYGGVWAKKNPVAFKDFCNAPIEHLTNFSLFKDFKEGMGMIKDTMQEKESDKAYFEQRQKNIEEYRKMGIDATVKYAVSGTKEYKEEMEYYRKAGVFSAEK